MENRDQQLRRQLDALGRAVPPTRGPMRRLLSPRWRWARIPAGIVLCILGVFGFLPVIGLWMLPLGLLLLAVDLPWLQLPVNAVSIRSRRAVRRLRARHGGRP